MEGRCQAVFKKYVKTSEKRQELHNSVRFLSFYVVYLLNIMTIILKFSTASTILTLIFVLKSAKGSSIVQQEILILLRKQRLFMEDDGIQGNNKMLLSITGICSSQSQNDASANLNALSTELNIGIHSIRVDPIRYSWT